MEIKIQHQIARLLSRFRLKWHSVERVKRLKRYLLIVLLSGLAVPGTLYIWQALNKPISIVRIEGRFHHLSRQQLQNQLSSVVSNRFFSLQLKSVQKVLLSIPWVGHVEMKKKWPGTLLVKVTERVPSARWNESSLLDTYGYIFMPASTKSFDKLPLLQGDLRSAEKIWKYFTEVRKQLSLVSLNTTALSLDDAGEWMLTVDDVNIILGRKNKKKRLESFICLYNKQLQPVWKKVKRIDFRYTSGAAVAWKK